MLYIYVLHIHIYIIYKCMYTLYIHLCVLLQIETYIQIKQVHAIVSISVSINY